MRNNRTALLCLLLAVFLPAGPAGGAEAELHILSSLAKVPRSEPTPAFLAQFETPPLLHAAWGEAEALQFLVVAGENGLRNLKVETGEFVHPAGDVWEAGTVSADFVGFVTTSQPYYGTLRVGTGPIPSCRTGPRACPPAGPRGSGSRCGCPWTPRRAATSAPST